VKTWNGEFLCDRCGDEIDPNDEESYVCLHDWMLCASCRTADVRKIWETLEESYVQNQ